jgi:hypothetical protein
MDMTGVDEIDDLFFLFENTSSGLLCSDITSIQAKCQPGGTILFRVVLLNSTQWAGTEVTCSLDGDSFTSNVVTNGTHSRASFTAPGPYGAGDHTITVTDPPCGTMKIVSCGVSNEKAAGTDWEEFDAQWKKESAQEPLPQSTGIVGSYPNPFNPTTTIRYVLREDGRVTLKIHNILGEEVKTLLNEFQAAGTRSVTWDGTNNLGDQVSSGLYFVRLVAGDVVRTQKLVLTK